MTQHFKIDDATALAVRATSDPEPRGRLLIDTRLTQQYRLASPVGGAQIAPMRDKQGVLHVFTLGSNGRVYDVYQDPTSDSGWSIRDMQFSRSEQAVAIAAGLEKDGTTILFAGDGAGKLYHLRDRSGTSWQYFTTLINETVVAIKLCHDRGGTLRCTVQGSGFGHDFLYASDYTRVQDNIGIGNILNAQGDYQVTPMTDYQVGLDSTAGNDTGLSIYSAGMCSDTGNPPYLPGGKKTPWENGTDVAWAVDEPNGYLRIALAPKSHQDEQFRAVRAQGFGQRPLSDRRPNPATDTAERPGAAPRHRRRTR